MCTASEHKKNHVSFEDMDSSVEIFYMVSTYLFINDLLRSVELSSIVRELRTECLDPFVGKLLLCRDNFLLCESVVIVNGARERSKGGVDLA